MDFTAQPKPASALCGVVSADGKIAYPPGVKEITDKITTDEMIKRLKVSVWTEHSLKTFVVDDLSCCISALLGLAFRVSPTSFSKVSYHLLFDFSERNLISLKDIDCIFE